MSLVCNASLSALAVLILSACAAGPAPLPSASTASAIDAAFRSPPPPEPVPLPAPLPAGRRAREFESFPAADLAAWILPGQAAEIAAAEIYPARWGTPAYLFLWRAPSPSGLPGVCEIGGHGVSLRIENESGLSPQQRLDPPLQPFQTVAERRYRVAGSTEAGAPVPDCTGGRPYWDWSQAPSAAALHRAANLMERAQRNGSRSVSLSCSQMRVDERSGATLTVPCADAGTLLRQLRPDLIQRVSGTQCTGDLSRDSLGPCIAVYYDDPAAPGTHSFYTVRINPAPTRASRLEIVQGMLPPH